jgi:hypothetical protein
LRVYTAKRLFIPKEYCAGAQKAHLYKGIKETDLMIYVSMMDTCTKGMFGFGDSCDWDQYNRPIAGIINFCYGAIRLDSEGKSSPKSLFTATKIAMYRDCDQRILLTFMSGKRVFPACCARKMAM